MINPIVKLNDIQRFTNKDYNIFIIWDVVNHKWYLPRIQDTKIALGIFASFDKADKVAKDILKENYKIVDINLKENIPEDLDSICKFAVEFGSPDYVLIKIRQLVNIFIINNKKLKEQLTEQDTCKIHKMLPEN